MKLPNFGTNNKGESGDEKMNSTGIDDTQENKGSMSGDNLKQANQNDQLKDSENSPELTPEEKVVKLEGDLETAETQLADHYARLQRLQAEFDNYRKRTLKEKEDLIKHASERLVSAMLPVVDNFERALDPAQTGQELAAYAQGVEMIFRQLYDVLTTEGLAVIEAVGQAFDPNIHEAVLAVESEEYSENTVVEEIQKGYYLKDRVLRPSMVKVSC
ncbi:MAG: nucleotide exchange factor GrpE [Desulfitobacteriaceae bacterium]|nr:nucleotide exchange factor GrpE [Desulfitobacteriaceae bacterium]MDD4345998.1 nucleotide exchange factor GrpE [Desulfitobacteriaceae bacterium]MDD4400373.1 nucleotide exchange factor GrpE [Desulfitobacteriaceae bacterium]